MNIYKYIGNDRRRSQEQNRIQQFHSNVPLQVICKLQFQGELILILYIFIIQATEQECQISISEQKSILKRDFKNVLQKQAGALISEARQNFFSFGNLGSCLKDDPYSIFADGVPYTNCKIGKKISITLMQKYLLNTLKLWFWDLGYIFSEDIRYYTIIVYTVLNGVQTKIYDSNLATSIVKIKFDEQQVERFDVLNVGGNTYYRNNLDIIKADAYYSFS
ncbi:unnamed protein product (macronuclear) [Paramecium tetraurelia]|uniref:Transmembrane protein n=1 Tax=Paramecium tetraurelia TaxID=5888 RepID=A0CRW6_PARTE|nr:uncharacterized protein GSPATT00038883001 [Paramecium tetraurelia]CAK73533.1 unnamed protein product [Paramecium tetraurelia]|eukprot:XP_001440930.1 hypothetical protein (macronuclear) [Paramecium tetraurelia strain d4-2]